MEDESQTEIDLDENFGKPIEGITTESIPVNRILNGAYEAKLKEVVIIGFGHEDEVYFSSSTASMAQINLLLDLAKQRLFNQ